MTVSRVWWVCREHTSALTGRDEEPIRCDFAELRKRSGLGISDCLFTREQLAPVNFPLPELRDAVEWLTTGSKPDATPELVTRNTELLIAAAELVLSADKIWWCIHPEDGIDCRDEAEAAANPGAIWPFRAAGHVTCGWRLLVTI